MRLLAVILAASLLTGAQVRAQPADVQAGQQQTLDAAQLGQLVAPVALYPDALLTDILAASTNPAQVVEAERFAADPANASLPAEALMDAAAGHDWDPSVKALLAFPQVLQMLDAQLEWTEHLGQAFVSQQADVLNAVQRLRQQAELAGTLQNGPNESVVDEGGNILVNPPSAQEVYLPTDTACAYGPEAGCDGSQIAWSDGIILPFGYVQWGLVDWRRRGIRQARAGDGRYYGAARVSGPGGAGQGALWRPATHLPAGRGFAQAQFYAPPANVPFAQRSFAPRPALPMRSAAPVFRAPMPGQVARAPVAAAPHPAGVARAAGIARR